jgi:hypothetical protein
MDSKHSSAQGDFVAKRSSTEVKKPDTDMIPKDTLSFFKSLDKNTIIILVLLGLSLGTSFYLFKDLKKTKEQLNKISNDTLVEDVLEKVDANTQNIHTIDLKLDQLIKTMTQKTQAQQVQDQQIKQLMKLQTQKQAQDQVRAQANTTKEQAPQVPQYKSNSPPPFMGGRIPTEDDEDDEITIQDTHEIRI